MPLSSGNRLQSAIDGNPSGTTFCLDAGLYRLTSGLNPKAADRFVGQLGTVIDGSELLSGWVQVGGFWVHQGGTQQPASLPGSCADGTDACKYPDDVFIDDTRLVRVLSLAQLGPGEVYVDYSANQVVLADDPTGHTVEMSTAPIAFNASAPNVVLQGLTIQKFANVASQPAVRMTDGWVVTNCEIRLNHGSGVNTIGQGGVLQDSRIDHNGQLGLSGTGSTNARIIDNEIDHNNTAHYDIWWEAGGSKWTATTNLLVRGNYVHDNYGSGLWTDIDNVGTTYDGNRVVNNSGNGIFHEISYAALIENNVVSGNSVVGIEVSASSDVEVTGNSVSNNGYMGIRLIQEDRGSYLLTNGFVHDNTVRQCSGYAAGAVRVGSGDELFNSRNNRFVNNSYVIAGGAQFEWMRGDRTWVSWNGFGEDTSGSETTQGC